MDEEIQRLNDKLVELDKFTDTNDQQIREALANVTLTISDLRILIYGSDSLRLKGMAERLERLETEVKSLEVQKKGMVDQIKGARLTIIVLGLTTTTGIGALLTEILK